MEQTRKCRYVKCRVYLSEFPVLDKYCSESCMEKQDKLTEKLFNQLKKKSEKSLQRDNEFKKELFSKGGKARLKSKDKSVQARLALVKAILQKWCKMRDIQRGYHYCVDGCGKDFRLVDDPKAINGGHYLKAETYTNVSIHPYNIHTQHAPCNNYGQGLAPMYRRELVRRIGEDKVNRLEDMAQRGAWRFDDGFLIDYVKEINKQIKSLQFDEDKLVDMVENQIATFKS